MIEDLGTGVYCIDTGYLRPGLAASFLLRDGEEAAIIETGTPRSVPRILKALSLAGVAPEAVRWIIPTHVHLDHAGGAGALLAHCPNARLLVHPRGLRHMVDPAQLVAGAVAVYGADTFTRLYGTVVPAPAERVLAADDGSRWQLGSRTLRMQDTPGHARHHFCVWDEASAGWFTGDTLGVAYRELAADGRAFLMPTSTPVQFEPDALQASIDTLMAASPARFYLTHFGMLENTPGLVDGLRAEIDSYVQLCLETPPGPQAEAQLVETLIAHTVAKLRERGCRWQRAALERFLGFDMGLNAPGLLGWRSKHRAS